MSRSTGDAREVLWQGDGRNIPLLALTAVVGVLLLFVLGLMGLHPLAAALVAGAFAAVGVTFASVTVVVDRWKVTSGFGPWSWPRRTVRLDALTKVGTTRVDVENGRGGGRALFWPRTSGVMVVRPGEALVLESGGHPFVVSVDGGADAAGVINHLLQRPA